MVQRIPNSAPAHPPGRRGDPQVNQSPKQVQREGEQGIERDERGQEQPTDKEAAQR